MDKSSINEVNRTCKERAKNQFCWKKLKISIFFSHYFWHSTFPRELPQLFGYYSAHTICSSSCIIYISIIENFLTDFEFSINFKSFLLTFFCTLSTFVFPYSHSPRIAVTITNFCNVAMKGTPIFQEWQYKAC